MLTRLPQGFPSSSLPPSGTTSRHPGVAGQVPASQIAQGPATAQPPGRVSTGARSLATITTTANDLRCWAKFVRGTPTTPYDGEYGFDWMDWKRDPDPKRLNDEITEFTHLPIAGFTHWYDPSKKQYLPVSSDPHLKRKLQDQYQRLLVYGEDYYAAWLSVRPGQQVKVQLHIEALNNNPLQADYLTFGAHSSYEATVNGQVNEAIRITPSAGSTAQSPQVVDVSIKCLKACGDTQLQVVDEKGKVVGQLNVVSNAHTFHLPVRIVYLVKDGAAAAADLQALQATITGLNLKEYLNKHSLNQAQIQADFESTNQIHQLVFKQAEWAGKFYDVANNWYTDHTVVDPKNNSILSKTIFLDKVLADYAAKYEKAGSGPFRGLLLVVTNIKKNPADGEGGVSRVRPVRFRETLIYSTNLNDKVSYAHEMGHALGLDHSFIDKDTNANVQSLVGYQQQLETSIKALKSNQKLYAQNRAVIQSYLTSSQNSLKTNTDYYSKHPAEKATLEKGLQTQKVALASQKKDSAANDKQLAINQALLAESKAETATYGANPFKFKQGTTDNIMDYNQSTGVGFFHWQWRVMQNDVRSYYGN